MKGSTELQTKLENFLVLCENFNLSHVGLGQVPSDMFKHTCSPAKWLWLHPGTAQSLLVRKAAPKHWNSFSSGGGIPAGSSGSSQVPVPLCTAVLQHWSSRVGLAWPSWDFENPIVPWWRAPLWELIKQWHGSSCMIIHKALRILMISLTVGEISSWSYPACAEILSVFPRTAGLPSPFSRDIRSLD